MPSSGRWTQERMNRVGFAVGCCGFALAALAWLCPSRLVLQGRPEHSVPFRVAIRLDSPAMWHVGDLVEFRVRNLRPYYPPGTSFTKVVAGRPGDRLELDGRTFRINGAVIGTARTTDSQGRPAWLYHPTPGPDGLCPVTDTPSRVSSPTRCILPLGTLFVLGVHERSLDSRYWGLVRAEEVTGRVVPLL